MKKEDLTGMTFHYWTVLSQAEHTRKKWLCRCICGTERVMYAYQLKAGKPMSCGCYREWSTKQARPSFSKNPIDKTPVNQHIRKGHDINSIAAKAEKAKMSYGQYVAMKAGAK